MTQKGGTTLERLAVLETKVSAAAENQEQMLEKLDSLLTLRNRGMGVFWLLSSLIGTGIVGYITEFVTYFRGPHG